MTTSPNELWTTKNGDERTDKFPIVDIACYACEANLAKVVDYQFVHLEGYDRKSVFDCYNGTVTVKCKCGVGRVIHSKRGTDQGEKENLGVWLKEINDTNSREPENNNQGEGKADGHS